MGYGSYQITEPNQTPNTGKCSVGVRLWAIRFMVERETAQTAG